MELYPDQIHMIFVRSMLRVVNCVRQVQHQVVSCLVARSSVLMTYFVIQIHGISIWKGF